jgi:hypothetical protein
VHFHRPRAKTQLRRSLLVSKSCSEKVEDFALAAGRAGNSEDRCRIEPGQQRTRPEAPGDLRGIAVRLPTIAVSPLQLVRRHCTQAVSSGSLAFRNNAIAS